MKDPTKAVPQQDSLHFRVASPADAHALVLLINHAFRVELPYIEGDRTNPEGVRAYMQKGKFCSWKTPPAWQDASTLNFAETAAT
jgi:hypothetical protein